MSDGAALYSKTEYVNAANLSASEYFEIIYYRLNFDKIRHPEKLPVDRSEGRRYAADHLKFLNLDMRSF